jgi:hypothetical protein
MSNAIKQRPLDPIVAEFIAKGFDPRGAVIKLIQDLATRADKTTTNLGEIQSVAPILGRTEGIATTVTGLAATGDIKATTKVVGRAEGLGTTTANLDATGKLTSTDAIAADGTGSPLTGGKRGAIALDPNNRLANSFRANPVNVSNTPTSASTLSNDGVLTAIPVTASTNQFAPGGVSYNSGSVDPGSFGKFYITATDPTFAGGAVPFSAGTTPQSQTNSEALVNFGTITTAAGVAGTGGGNTGGTKGTAGGRGFNQ